jgi:hypothetical protein
MAAPITEARQDPLEQITLRGYKSIRELEELRLNQGLNVLIGANVFKDQLRPIFRVAPSHDGSEQRATKNQIGGSP